MPIYIKRMNKKLLIYTICAVLIFSLAIGFLLIGFNKEGVENKIKYDSNNFDVEYHDDPAKILADLGASESKLTWVYDNSGNKIAMPYSESQGTSTYYQPGAYKFGASTYVPKYEDSVYLSRTTNLAYMAPVTNTSAQMSGICNFHKDNPDKLEEACNSVSPDTCGSMSCCVLLGGAKCVSGDEKGPKMKSNYSDITVTNRDYYYYQGKCYGNCPNN